MTRGRFEKGNKINLGRKKSETTRNKISDTLKRKGIKPNPLFVVPFKKGNKINVGKKRSEETKIKISQKRLGKKYPNLSLSLKGRHLSPKTEFKGGKEHPNWNEGSSFEPYGIEFNIKLKNLIRKRDNQVCINCGIHRERLNRTLDVHHINYDKKCNLPQNLISLCHKCHSLTNFNREYWIKLFQKKLSKLYNYQYSEDGKIVLNLKINFH